MLPSFATPRCQPQPGAGGSSVAGRPPAGVCARPVGAARSRDPALCRGGWWTCAPEAAAPGTSLLGEPSVASGTGGVRPDRERAGEAAAQELLLQILARALDPDVGEQPSVAI